MLVSQARPIPRERVWSHALELLVQTEAFNDDDVCTRIHFLPRPYFKVPYSRHGLCPSPPRTCRMAEGYMRLCLACGVTTTQDHRRLLSRDSNESLHVVLLLRRWYQCLLDERKERLTADRLSFLYCDDSVTEGYTCISCFRMLENFSNKEAKLKSKVAEALQVISCLQNHCSGPAMMTKRLVTMSLLLSFMMILNSSPSQHLQQYQAAREQVSINSLSQVKGLSLLWRWVYIY